MQSILQRIYGDRKGEAAFARLTALLDACPKSSASRAKSDFTATDAVLITYGDTLLREGERPLSTLRRFCIDHLHGILSGVHILPFFPFSSDDGFSVTDFAAVRTDLGDWADIRAIGGDFKLMVDLVANHVSARSRWFENYLNDVPGFETLAIEIEPGTNLSAVTRPRALPLLTPFEKKSGEKVWVWTTFSDDQIDLNYQSLDVLEMMVNALLLYVSNGARLIRLDAIAYLWKEIGTSCIHLPRTFDVVRLFRKIFDRIAPGVALVTETNVPHEENIAYFGNGQDMAQMVYNFTLPPLLLHGLCTGTATRFSQWAATLETPSATTTFFNFTASHDGVGVRPLEGILPPSEISWLADRVVQNGGRVSTKNNPDGTASPYELNITYLDALKDPEKPEDQQQIPRFLASQATALVLAGVPAIYLHSLLGSTNWTEGVRITGRARTINRAQLQMDTISAELADPTSRRSRIFFPYLEMLRIRRRQPAFAPDAAMRVLDLDERVFGVKRTASDQSIHALTNFSARPVTVALPDAPLKLECKDLLSGKTFDAKNIKLPAYGVLWLQ